MNEQLFYAALLGYAIGAGFATAICSIVMHQRSRVIQTLYPLGHITEGTTYLFRLPVIKEDQTTVTLEDVSAFALDELEDCGIPDEVLAKVHVSVSGCMIKVEGTPQHIQLIETTHHRWLNQVVGIPTESNVKEENEPQASVGVLTQF